MTLWLVKQPDANYKLHDYNGDELGEFAEQPTEKTMANSLTEPWRLHIEGYNFRDLTIKDEVVPWNT